MTMQCVVAFPVLPSGMWVKGAGRKMETEKSMTWSHRQVLLKYTFLSKWLNPSFYVCSINERERWNILSSELLLFCWKYVQGFNHIVFSYTFILGKS